VGGPGDVEVTLLPEELEGLDEAAVKALYEEKAEELRVGGDGGGGEEDGAASGGATAGGLPRPQPRGRGCSAPRCRRRAPVRALPPPTRPCPPLCSAPRPQAAARREDFSDMVAAQAAVQKRKIQQRADAKAAKKTKGPDFKF
jgi:hypothetical protein